MIRFLGAHANVQGTNQPEHVSPEQVPDESPALLRIVLEHSLDGLVLAGADGIIRYVSPVAARLVGYAPSELIGRRADELVHPDDGPATTRILQASLSQPGVAIFVSTRLLHKNGEWRWMEGMFTNLLDEPGVNAIVTSFRDITDRRAIDHALNESRARLAGIIDSAMDAIIATDAAQRIRLFNPAAEKMFGWSSDQVLGQPIDLLIPERFQAGHRQHIREFGETGVTTRAMGKLSPLSGVRQDQSEFPVEASISQNEVNGEKIYTVILRDITQRKQAEEQIRYQAGLIQNVSDAIISTGPDLITKSWNKAAETMYGWRADEAIGKPTTDILQSQFAPGERERVLKILRDRGEWRGEVVQLHRDGTRIHVMSATTLLKDSQGNLVGMVAVNRDVTELKLARERAHFLEQAGQVLASSLDYQATLQTVAGLAVPQIADWCVITLVDQAGNSKMVAGAHTEPDKEKWSQLFQYKLAPGLNPNTATARAIRTGSTVFIPELDEKLASIYSDPEMLRLLRQLKLHSSIAVPLVVQGRVLGAISLTTTAGRPRYTAEDTGVAEELARRAAIAVENARLYREARELNEELEKRVQERTAQLEDANQELEAFSYSVSHDLRAPLRAIDGFSRILMRDAQTELSPDSLRYLNLVRDSTRQMGQLVDDLLAFSRLSRQALTRQTVTLDRVVRQVCDELQGEEGTRTIDWQIGELGVCRADLALLKQVWVNLIANALKYTRTREKARIEIGRTITNTETFFYIKDNGVGFDMRYAHKLFGVFQRLHRAEDYEGTGVGLAIVHRIVARHGGRVWAEAVVDQGATFYFTLGAD